MNMGTILDGLCNDIKSIVYKMLHRDIYKLVQLQFGEKYMRLWSDELQYYVMDVQLNPNLASWRRGFYTYDVIYDMLGEPGTFRTSKRCKYQSIRWN